MIEEIGYLAMGFLIIGLIKILQQIHAILKLESENRYFDENRSILL